MDLTLGHSAAVNLRTVLDRQFTVFSDPLSHGPVRPFSVRSLHDWVRRRMSFWNQIGPVDSRITANKESKYLELIETILDSKSLKLWVASDVEGLMLSAWLCCLVRECKSKCRIELVQFPRRAGQSIGEMPESILLNHPAPTQIVGGVADFFVSFWLAWSSPSPHLMLELFDRVGRFRSRRYLMSRLLDRYPDAKTGLSRCDQALLKNVRKHGPKMSSVIGNTLADYSSSFESVGDHLLFSRLDRLSRPKKRGALVTILRDDHHPFRGSVTLTQLGDDVLAERTNALDTARRIDWIGGVRIDSSQPVIWVRTLVGLSQRQKTK